MTIYFGPYIRVPAYMRDEAVSKPACSASCGGATRLSSGTRFCPDCGAPVASRATTVAVRRVLGASEAADALGAQYVDLMASDVDSPEKNYAVWVPNRHDDGRHLDGTASVDIALEADDLARHSEMSQFLLRHGQFISDVEGKFGVALTLHYGVVILNG